MPRPDVQLNSTVDTLVSSSARTTTGVGSAVLGYGKVTQLRAQLSVTSATGTTPTLDVVLEDSLDGTNWNVIGTFSQVTTATTQALNITTPFADRVRARWTIGGTTPSFTFSVLTHTQ